MTRTERWIGDWIELFEALIGVITFSAFSLMWSMNYYYYISKKDAKIASEKG